MTKTAKECSSTPNKPHFPCLPHPSRIGRSSTHQSLCRHLLDSFKMIPKLETIQKLLVLRLFLGLCWCCLHIVVSVVHFWSRMVREVLWYMISSGMLKEYKDIKLDKLRYLGVVVDSEEARNKAKIKQLLRWLSDLGVKYVIMYDAEGVMKKFMENDWKNSINASNNSSSVVDSDLRDISSLVCEEKMKLEFLSISDGKDGVAKAASFLCSKYLNRDSTEKVFTETDMDDALKEVGCSGPDPDLLLVYGPARCHLGFPSWRIRYTEILHMGQLKSMKYGAIVKAIYDFSKKHQNYGS